MEWSGHRGCEAVDRNPPRTEREKLFTSYFQQSGSALSLYFAHAIIIREERAS